MGVKLNAGDTITFQCVLVDTVDNAAVMLNSNHQTVNVYLGNDLLYSADPVEPGENPGMALYFIPLPENYLHKTLRIELTSPYAIYSGRTGAVYLGAIPSLEAFAVSASMKSVIMMAMCLLLGITTIIFTLIQALYDLRRPENLAAGIFAVIWALYYVCTEYIVYQFFSPKLMSVLSLGLYFSFQAPLSLYFYFSFRHYKKCMLPAAILHNVFPLVAIILQVFDIMDLPQLISINNILLSALAYTACLAVLEALKKNRVMAVGAIALIPAYLSMLYNFYVFYSRHSVPPYFYKATYFLLIICLLGYNIQQFFRSYYHNRQENASLALQSKLAISGYEQIKNHLREVGGIKHEISNHFTALSTLLRDGRYEEATKYLNKYTEQTESINAAVYHEHYIINSLAGGLIRKADELGVKAEINLKTSPVRINDPDLYSLLSNMIDNALEACAKMPPSCERFVRLSLLRRDCYLTVVCENSWDGDIRDESGVVMSSKKEKGHGYGLWIIKRIAEKYDGHAGIEYDGDGFIITAALYDPIC